MPVQRRTRLSMARAISVLLLCASIIWLVRVLFAEDVGKADSWSSLLTGIFTFVGGIVTLVITDLRGRTAALASLTQTELVEASTALAGSVLEDWRREAEVRSLGHPEPMPVLWQLSDSRFMDYQPAVGSFALASSTTGLDATALLDEFLQLPRKRLVIIGSAGSGKSTLALLLMLGLLSKRARGEEVEVPVLFSLLEWDPVVTPRVQDYMVASLQRDYRWLEKFGARTARSLVERGMVLPVLDGLDEVPGQRRVRVLDALRGPRMTSLSDSCGGGVPGR